MTGLSALSGNSALGPFRRSPDHALVFAHFRQIATASANSACATEAKVNNPNNNPNCDRDKCRYSAGEVRSYPGSHPALTLCRTCWAHESAPRRFKTGRPALKWAPGDGRVSVRSSYTDELRRRLKNIRSGIQGK